MTNEEMEAKIDALENGINTLSVILRVHHNMVDKEKFIEIATSILTREELELIK